jgi:hypothetical protein
MTNIEMRKLLRFDEQLPVTTVFDVRAEEKNSSAGSLHDAYLSYRSNIA